MRRASIRFWTLILALTLVVSGTVALPGHVRADYAPGETSPPPGPDTGAGDPDVPDGKAALVQRVGPPRGAAGPGYRTTAIERGGLAGKWMWSFRVAFSSVYRILFRI